MKKVLKIFTISMVLVGVLVAILAGTVLAAGPQDNGSGSNSGQAGNSAVSIVSQLTGINPAQIQEQRQAGKSLVQIAAAKNITEDSLIDAVMAEKQAVIKKQVAAGTITQAQADQRLAQMKERVKLAVNRTSIGPPDWAGANANGLNGNSNGANMRQGGSRNNQANCTGTPGTCSGVGNMVRAGRAAK